MWSVDDARNRFSALVEAARRGEPQLVTKHVAPAVVILAVEEYARLKALDEQRTSPFTDHLALPQDDEVVDRLEMTLANSLGKPQCSTQAAGLAPDILDHEVPRVPRARSRSDG